jgi:hypothetical protein
MRTALLTTAILVSALVSGDAAGNAALAAGPGITIYGSAPIGHLQPRAVPFSPQSPAEQAEQHRMSVFDAEQQKQDEELDRRLNICRGC